MVDYLEVARDIYTDSQNNQDAGWAIAAALIAIAERLPPVQAEQTLTINVSSDLTPEQIEKEMQLIGDQLKTIRKAANVQR